MKQNSSVAHPGGDIWVPSMEHGEKVYWEGELCLVIGKKCRNATKENALSHLCGYTVGNDIANHHW